MKNEFLYFVVSNVMLGLLVLVTVTSPGPTVQAFQMYTSFSPTKQQTTGPTRTSPRTEYRSNSGFDFRSETRSDTRMNYKRRNASTNHFGTSTTKLYSSIFWDNNNNNNNNNEAKAKQSKKTKPLMNDLDSIFVLTCPAIMACMAFYLYPETSAAFHTFVDTASGHTWAAVDDGRYLSDLIAPALNGPVASFISLLFGTLTSMTVSTLYQRQATMFQATSDLLDDVRLAEINFQFFPARYKKRAMALLQEYQSVLAMYFNEEHDPTPEEIKKGRERGRLALEKLLILLHNISTATTTSSGSDNNDKSATAVKVSDRILGESYETINRIIRNRSNLNSSYDVVFPIWHYGNLALLAMGICTIFLVLTDRTALQFLGGFQLRMCWAMLIGTISMLAAVIYDLNTPLSGVFQLARRNYESVMTLTTTLDETSEEVTTSTKNNEIKAFNFNKTISY